MSNQVVTLGYLKSFVSGILSVNSGDYKDTYCPSYKQLTDGTFCSYYKSNANPLNTTTGILIPSCSVGDSYSSTQLVVRSDLQLLYQKLQSITVSADRISISCCGGNATLSTTAHFNLQTKQESETTSATTNTSVGVTALYSDSASYTTISNNTVTFNKNSVDYPTTSTAAARSTIITAEYTWSGISKTNTITITQGANSVGDWMYSETISSYISISPNSMSFDSAGGTKSYSVTKYDTDKYVRKDSCDSIITSKTEYDDYSVTPSSYSVNNSNFTCTNSSVTVGTNSDKSERSCTLTVSYLRL